MSKATEKQIGNPAQEAWAQNMRIMHGIVRDMKEIPILPSEKPKDSAVLQRVEFPEKGGIMTYMEGHKEPYQGFPFFEFVEKIDLLKKIVRSGLSGMYHSLKKRNRLWFLTLIPSVWFFKTFVYSSIYTAYRIVERFKIRRKRYSPSMRELHRAFSKEQGETPWDRELRLMIRDILCMVLEFDNAYRFRFQDIVMEMDKKRLKRRPIKELNRLLDIMSGREKEQTVKDSWKLLKLFVSIYLRIDRKMRKLLVNVLLELDLKEIELTKEDKHYCRPRKDYIFGFQKHE